MEQDVDVRDIVHQDGLIVVYAEPDQFAQVQEALKQYGVTDFEVAEFEMLPQNEVTLSADDRSAI